MFNNEIHSTALMLIVGRCLCLPKLKNKQTQLGIYDLYDLYYEF